MFLYKPKYSVKINLDSEEVFLNGSAEVAENTKLQGSLEATVPSDYRRSSSSTQIHLSFLCNLKIKSKDLFSQSHNQSLFKLNWTFKLNFKDQKTLKFPFVAKLPGDLPCSLDLDGLKISYQFRVYEECPLLQYNVITKDIKVFRLSRVSRPGFALTHANSEPLLNKVRGKSSTGSDQSFKYSLTYPMTWYDMDKSMPIKLRLTLNSDQRVHSVIYSIRQAVSLGTLNQHELGIKSDYQYQLSTKDAYIIPSNLIERNCQLGKNQQSEDDLISFKLLSALNPAGNNQKKYANFSSDNFEIQISHYLLAQICVIDSDDGLITELIRVPVTFLPRPKFSDNNDEPPAYEDVVSR